ncbi:MAG: hypothetical protein AB1671_27940 [Thermodesulfobacteriota bacterium]
MKRPRTWEVIGLGKAIELTYARIRRSGGTAVPAYFTMRPAKSPCSRQRASRS